MSEDIYGHVKCMPNGRFAMTKDKDHSLHSVFKNCITCFILFVLSHLVEQYNPPQIDT